MNFQLINPINENFTALQQVLYNRNIPPSEFNHYMNTTDEDVSLCVQLGEEKLNVARIWLESTIKSNSKVCVVVDSDNDGFTSAAMLINYLHQVYPEWVEGCLYYFIHEGKQHGLSDFPIDEVNAGELSLIILPDAGSNDVEEARALHNKGIEVMCLDHHLYDDTKENPALIINSQDEGYPNHELSGAGVTYMFCKYLDNVWNRPGAADYFLDLCAVGNAGDMMSLTSIETKHLVNKGIKQLNNPFISYLAEKNDYSIQKKGGMCYDAIGWYISPFINAIVRSGTQDEKRLVFESMLEHKAYQVVLSNKRGHKPGDTELLVEQCMRLVTNVKNRQQRAIDVGMTLLESKIKAENLLEHKVLLFKLNFDDVDANIRGLAGNKIMSKYQRPVCVLTKGIYEDCIVYAGSARGCEIAGIPSFKNVCDATGVCNWTVGHGNAFGLSINAENVDKFLEKTDELLQDMSNEPIYYCDFVYEGNNVNPDDLLDIARHPELWGKDFNEPLIGIKGLKVTKDMITLMAKNTLKIAINPYVSLIKFSIPDEEFEKLYSEHGSVEVNIVGNVRLNEWMGSVSAQIMLVDMEVVGVVKWLF